MKKLRRSLALLLIAAILVNSTDFSLLTVNAEEQTATEGEAPSGNNESSEEQDAEAQSSETGNTEAEGEDAAPPEDGSGDAAGPAEGQDGSDGTVSQPGTGETGDPAGQPGTGETDGSAGQPADDGSEGTENSGSDGAENPPVSDEDQGTNGEQGSGENPDTPSDDGESEDAQDGTSDADTPSGEEQVPAVPGAEQPVDPDQVLPPANLAPSLPEETDEETVPTIIGVDFTDEDKAAYVLNQTVPIGAALDAVLLPETVIGIVDAADGADGEEAADETVELTVLEWVITGPEGVTEFDTSASEEDENLPKQGFYEFAPVLADLPEGYEWSETVPGGYDTWDEYLENWMKISVTVGAENALNKADPEIAAAGGEYTVSISQILRMETGYLTVPETDPENAGKYFAYYNAEMEKLTLLVDNSTYVFTDTNTANLGIVFGEDVDNTSLKFNGVSLEDSRSSGEPLLNFDGVQSASVSFDGSITTFTNINEASAIYIPKGTEVSVSGDISVTGYGKEGVICNEGTLNIVSGNISISGGDDGGLINNRNSGILNIQNDSDLTLLADRGVAAIIGGTMSVNNNAVFSATGNGSDDFLQNVNAEKVIVGYFTRSVPNRTLTLSGMETREIELGGTTTVFATNLEPGSYRISSTSEGRSSKFIGKLDGAGDDTADFIVQETGITIYKDIHEIFTPVFWQAHAENVTFDSAVLVTEVDTARYNGSTPNYGDQVHKSYGFRLTKVIGSDGQEISSDQWASAFSKGYETDNVWDQATEYDPNTEEHNPEEKYTIAISGLKQGYTYYFIPRIVTSAGVEEPVAAYGEGSDQGLEANDPVTNEQTHIIEVKPFYLNMPDTINFTYGEIAGNVNDANVISSQHPSLTMSKDSANIAAGTLIPADQQALGISGTFYVYRADQAVTDAATLSSTDWDDVWDAGTYGPSSQVRKAWITFRPDDLTRFGLVSQEVTVNVAKRPVTVFSLGKTEKVYDGNNEINVVSIQAAPAPVGNEEIGGCTSIQNTFNSDGTGLSVSGDVLTGYFEDANAGDSKTITIRDLILTGNRFANYVIQADAETSDEITVEGGKIARRPITVKPKDVSIKTGQKEPNWELELTDNTTLATTDNLADVMGTVVYTLNPAFPSFDESQQYQPTSDYTISYTTSGSSSNYEITDKRGVLTIKQDLAEGLYVVSPKAVASTEDWNNTDVTIKADPTESNIYDQVRIGILDADGSIVWDVRGWQNSYTISETTAGIIIQLKDSETGAFTSWTTTAENLKIDKTAPWIEKVKYTDYKGSFIEDAINFLTFGNYYKGRVIFTVTVKDNEDGSGPRNLYYKTSSSDKYIPVAIGDDGTAEFSLDVAGTYEISLKIDDVAGNETSAVLKNKDGDLGSSKWIIDTNVPQITGVTVQAQDRSEQKDGKDGNKWYWDDVDVTVSILDNEGLDILKRQKDAGNAEDVWDAKKGSPSKPVKNYLYTEAVTGNTKGTVYRYNVSDLAGNWTYDESITENWKSTDTIRIDKNDPVIGEITMNPSGWVGAEGSVSLEFTVGDTGSGVHSVTYSRTVDALGQGIAEPDEKTIAAENIRDGKVVISDLTAAGTYTITVYDKAGRSASSTVEIDNLDKDLPVISNVEGATGAKWNSSAVTLTVTASDAPDAGDSKASGLATIAYSLDGSSWSKPEAWGSAGTHAITIRENGKHTVYIRVTDAAENVSESGSYTVWIDTEKPELTVSAESGGVAYMPGIPTKNEVVFTLSAGENTSGLTYYVKVPGLTGEDWISVEDFVKAREGYTWDSNTNTLTVGADIAEGSSFIVNDSFSFRAVSGSGLSDDEPFGNVQVTMTKLAAPVVELDPEGSGVSGWYNSNTGRLTVKVHAVEAEAGQAEVTTKYKYWRAEETEPDDSTGTSLTGNIAEIIFDEDDSGEYTFKAWAEDTVDSESTDKTVTFMVDLNAPEIVSVTYKEVNNTDIAEALNKLTFGIFFNKGVQVTVVTEDGTNESGIDSLSYRINGEEEITANKSNNQFTFTLDIGTEGIVSLKLKDEAGNTASQNLGTDLGEEVGKEPVWLLENTPPEVGVLFGNDEELSEDPAASKWYTGDVTVTTQVSDADSGLQKIEYVLDGDASGTITGETDGEFSEEKTEEYAFSETMTQEGVHMVWVMATDNAGNESANKQAVVKIDRTAPTIGTVTFDQTNWSTADGDWTNDGYTARFTVQDLKGENAPEGTVTSDVAKVTWQREGDVPQTIQTDGNGNYEFTVEKNGSYTITAKDAAGNEETYTFTVSNVDKLGPVLTGDSSNDGLYITNPAPEEGQPYPDDVRVRVDVKDADATEEYGKSGIDHIRYDWVASGSVESPNYRRQEWDDNPNSHVVVMDETGMFDLYVQVYDKAGNMRQLKKESIRINNGKPALDITVTDAAGQPYEDGTWSNSEYIDYHLGLANNAEYEDVLLWAKLDTDESSDDREDLDSYFSIEEFANKIGADWIEETHTLRIRKEKAISIRFAVTNSENGNLNPEPILTTKLDRTKPVNTDNQVLGDNSRNPMWYTGGQNNDKYPSIELGILKETADPNKAPVSFRYKVWNTIDGGTAETAKTITLKGSAETVTVLSNVITRDGKWGMEYWIQDEAGNESEHTTVSTAAGEEIWVDTTDASTVKIVVSPDQSILDTIFGIFAKDTVTVTVTASDALSGLGTLKYEIDTDTPENPKTGTAVFSNGAASFKIHADETNALYEKGIRIAVVDVAGNETDMEPVTYGTRDNKGKWTVESMPPELTLEVAASAPTGKDGWYNTPVTFTATAKDKGGVGKIELTRDGETDPAAAWQEAYKEGETKSEEVIITWNTANESNPSVSDIQGKLTVTASASDIAGNTVTGTEEAGTKMTVQIDTEAPVIGDARMISDNVQWTNQNRIYQFTLTDTTSDINEKEIRITGPSGTNPVAEKVDGQENTWQFEAEANGSYSIRVEDMAGNTTEIEEFVTAKGIDKEKPENATVEIEPVEKGEGEWYNGEGTWVQVQIEPPEQDDGSPITTWYQLTDISSSDGVSHDPVEVITGDLETQLINIPDGQWRVTVYTTDDAGNCCESAWEKDLKVDNTDPVIDTGSLRFTDSKGGLLEDLIHWLGFGNFYKDAVTVTMPISDAESGVKTLYWQIPGQAEQSKDVQGETEASITLKTELSYAENGSVQVWLEDVAGNVSDKYELKKDADGSGKWILEGEAPTVTVEITGSPTQGEDGWYKTDVTLAGTARDSKSGLYEVKWIDSVKETEDSEEETEETPVAKYSEDDLVPNFNPVNSNIILQDGIHSITLYAMDNATNVTSSASETYKIDTKAPEVTVDGFQGDTPVNDEQNITIEVSDATSGVKEGSLTISYEKDGETVNLVRGTDFTISEQLRKAEFKAKEDAVYTISLSDNAGNVWTDKFRNHLVEYVQGNEIVTVNNVKAVNGERSSPWYNDVPEVVIKTPEEADIDVTTYYYLVRPTEMILGSDGNWTLDILGSRPMITYAQDSQEVTFDSSLTPDRIKHFSTTNAAQASKTIETSEFKVNGAKQDGVWLLYIQTLDEAGNVSENVSKYYIKIDRGDPVIGEPSVENEDKWASAKKVTFTASDSWANNAPENDSRHVSGISGTGHVTVTSPSGATKEFDVVDNKFEYTAEENGDYIIVVYDNINAMEKDGKTPQEANEKERKFTVSKIDKQAPDNAKVSTDPAAPNGNIVEGEESQCWYIESWPTIVITAPEQPVDNAENESKITTHYEITCNGTTAADGTGTIVPGTEKFEYAVNADGKWEVTVYTEDEAGNKCERETYIYYADKDAPVIDGEKIVITPVNEGNLADIMNKLTFGIFFKEAVKITVPVTEGVNESGIAGLEYQLNGDEWKQASANSDGTYSFQINPEFKGTIRLKATDKAGNESVEKTLTNDIVDGEADESTWVVDSAEPTISISTEDRPTEYGWYNKAVQVKVNVDGGTSGVGEVTWTMERNSEDAEPQTNIYDANTTDGIKQTIEDTVDVPQADNLEDGVYTVIFNAKDNALNEADSVQEIYQIDREKPVQVANSLNVPKGWMQSKTVAFRLADETSGIQKNSVTVILKGEDGAQGENIQAAVSADQNDVIQFESDGLSELAREYACSFTALKNGTYLVSALDAAGNEYTAEIEVNQIDAVSPEAPVIRVAENSTEDNNIQAWYNTEYPAVTGVKNDTEDTDNNIAPVTTMYKMWNTDTEQEPDTASELIASGNDNEEATVDPPVAAEGRWKVVMWNVDAAGNKSAETTAEFGVDTVKPTFTDETDYPAGFLTEYDVKFTLEDLQKGGSENGGPSGVNRDSVQIRFKPVEGSEEILSSTDYSYDEASGIYTIRAAQNGVYTITAGDIAGNELGEQQITVDKISTEAPYNVKLEILGTKGSIDGQETGWYLYQADIDGVLVRFTTNDPTNVGPTVHVDVRYKIWEEGTAEPGDADAVSVTTLGPNQTVELLVKDGGVWNIEYWTVSESGVECDARENIVVRYDPKAAVIEEEGIEYRTVNDTPAAKLINWLTFGTFFNEAVKVQIPVSDEFSGASRLSYRIPKSDGTYDEGNVRVKESGGRYYAEFTIPVETKGQIRLILADTAGNTTELTMKSLATGEPTDWVIETSLPTAQSLKPSLNATGVAVMGEDALTEIELFFSERVVWKEGGQLTISTGEKTYTATMHEDEIPLIPDEGAACTTSVPIERFVDENGEPLKLELNEIYTLVVKAGAFMDYATNENVEALLSAFQTGQELDPGEETPLSDLGLELSEGVTMFPAFDPETTGYTLIIGEEAMDGNHLAQDMVFSPILKGDANIEEAVLTDMMGRELASYEIGADGSFTVPKEAIEEHKNYFIRMTASRYGIETVYNFLVSTSAYNEVITLATSDMPAIEVDGLRNTVDVAEETVEGNKVVVQFVASIPREETTAQQLDPIRAVAGDEKGYYSLDLAINKFRSDGVSEELHELDMPVRITVELPDELLGKDTYEVYRNHEGAVDRLDCTLSADGKRLSFESDRFSFYTIAYTPYTPESTGDNGGSGGGTTTETVYVQVPGGTVTETVYITSGGGRPGSGTVTTVPVTDGSADTEEIPASSPRTDEEPDQTAETEEEETKVTSQEDVLAGIPQGLALADLACMVASMMLAEYSYCKQKKLRKILGTIFAAALIILFFLTQPLEGLIAWTDRWTIFFVITAAVHAIVTVIPQRKDKDGDGEDGQDGAKPAEG
ncbi:hypothetical protein B5F29_09795 [Lachnoclostridium sp. An196]|uniref:YDG domain-containing protein n=1 Tax=Lachnoclostridium sp. An196 TaxID=1965583 RepID=UPI000B37B5DB|nr:YDG domain-containing protein [Lachnoclostridium sp. An196]OUP19078.1 hypothetical protein B5F29_09795 [Lachnoclostridium sp. An196]